MVVQVKMALSGGFWSKVNKKFALFDQFGQAPVETTGPWRILDWRSPNFRTASRNDDERENILGIRVSTLQERRWWPQWLASSSCGESQMSQHRRVWLLAWFVSVCRMNERIREGMDLIFVLEPNRLGGHNYLRLARLAKISWYSSSWRVLLQLANVVPDHFSNRSVRHSTDWTRIADSHFLWLARMKQLALLRYLSCKNEATTIT